MSDTVFDTDVDVRLSNENGDHERFAHYVQKEDVLEGLIYGRPVVALCGKVWIPSRDPEKFPVCPKCKEIYEQLADNGNI
jgi:hypothetical protein